MSPQEQALRYNTGKPRGFYLLPPDVVAQLASARSRTHWGPRTVAMLMHRQITAEQFVAIVYDSSNLTEMLKMAAQALFHSATMGKYPVHNWLKGLPLTEIADSYFRHVFSAAEQDFESGLTHQCHAGANLLFLVNQCTWPENYVQFDDRPAAKE